MYSAKRRVLPLILAFLALASAIGAQDHDFTAVGRAKKPDAVAWGGLLWTTTETKSFYGRPRTATDSDAVNFVTVAYDRFVSYYDVKGRNPRWVAYVADRASYQETKRGTRTGTAFVRPRDFFTEGIVADFSVRLGVEPNIDNDYSDKIPPGLAPADRISKTMADAKARAQPAIIERGHLAPNNTMKTWGTPAQGVKAQKESFSLANVVPQMKKHNAPTWSGLEMQCLVWADQLGSVAVVVGPIFEDGAPKQPILERKTDEPTDIPFPKSLFCVVIGKYQGKPTAIGFIMPQQTVTYAWSDDGKAVPIDEIERRTGINFMPALGEPNPIEQTVDRRWFATP